MQKNRLIVVFVGLCILVLAFGRVRADCSDYTILKANTYPKYLGISLHEKPNFFSEKITKAPPEVMWLRERVDAYILVSFFRNNIEYTGWVFGGYYGKPMPGDYHAFPKPILYQVKTSVKTESVLARKAPSISSPAVSYCAGCQLHIIGRKGAWLKTSKEKWIYYDLMEPVE